MKVYTRIKDNVILDHQFKDGGYEMSIVKKRSVKHNNMYWKLCEFFSMHCGEWMNLPNKEFVHRFLKEKLGYVVYKPNGEYSHTIEFSTDFNSMDQDEFKEHYSRSLDVIALELGCASEEIINELVNFF